MYIVGVVLVLARESVRSYRVCWRRDPRQLRYEKDQVTSIASKLSALVPSASANTCMDGGANGMPGQPLFPVLLLNRAPPLGHMSQSQVLLLASST
ncbi:hypothetical protein PISMIDRAFT_678520 [Pisolithus microcarpus 441]|uniref:Uncharacterized protein n=1 Tax=Pisolithus microcarpus 441 TaxID=765257 RepID=A0A0C9ZP11_9AGAM|nr:hypothetical protein BKA83DRAFT_678519 [Pisolithus microcarpus]KIK24037.1 hypothetical protein PISMIDRAFT_678520 [Pisolithus microcarpus 441]